MLRIGLTGGIASGKSTVAEMLREMGAVVIDADKIAHEIMEPDSAAWQEIVAWQGERILASDRRIDRRALGGIVFADKAAKAKLESITHPQILRRIEEEIKAYEAAGVKTVVLDIPLLIECGWQDKVDQIWLVYVEPEIQLRRLQTRGGFNESEALLRIAAQMNLAEKAVFADLIIDNGKTLSETKRQIEVQCKKYLL